MVKSLKSSDKKYKNVFIFFLILLNTYCVLLGIEVFLQFRSALNVPDKITFNTQFLHPYYFFSFPTSKQLLKNMNDEKTWVDERGYRGPGPEAKGERKLAFLMGGSTAFGFPTDNDQTISSYLNRIQNEYYFVNAGVPSWNSFQELVRVLKQALPEKPALIIHLNGFNDIITAYERRGNHIPADAPESYETLANWVEDIRSTDVRSSMLLVNLLNQPVIKNIFLGNIREKILGPLKTVRSKVAPYSSDWKGVDTPIYLQTVGENTSRLYLENMDLISEICKNRGIQFKVFFQPMLYMHPSYVTEGHTFNWGGVKFTNFYHQTHQIIVGEKRPYLSDLTYVFNQVGKEKLSAEIFFDSVHFRPKGHEVLANQIWKSISNH